MQLLILFSILILSIDAHRHMSVAQVERAAGSALKKYDKERQECFSFVRNHIDVPLELFVQNISFATSSSNVYTDYQVCKYENMSSNYVYLSNTHSTWVKAQKCFTMYYEALSTTCTEHNGVHNCIQEYENEASLKENIIMLNNIMNIDMNVFCTTNWKKLESTEPVIEFIITAVSLYFDFLRIMMLFSVPVIALLALSN